MKLKDRFIIVDKPAGSVGIRRLFTTGLEGGKRYGKVVAWQCVMMMMDRGKYSQQGRRTIIMGVNEIDS